MTSAASGRGVPVEAGVCELRAHDHLCLIYDSDEEQLRAIVPFVRRGIEARERCFYVARTETVAGVEAALRAGGIDLDRAVGEGRLALATERQAYLATGRFDVDAMIDAASGAAAKAVGAGYAGLRVIGEMSWALGGAAGADQLLEYEVKVNQRLPKIPATAVCQYDRRRFPPEVIQDVIRTHPLVAVGGRICRNFYYVPPEELLGPARSGREVDRLLENILEREQAEDALRRSERRLSLVLEGTRDAFWDWDLLTGEVTYSPRFLEMLGYPAQPGRRDVESWRRLVHPDDLPAAWAAFQAHLGERSEQYEAEYRARAADGSWRWILDRGRVVARTSAGRPARMAGTMSDVTERRSLQARLEFAGRLATVGTLAAGVAHEVNNPLAFVTSNLEHVAEGLAGVGARPELAAECVPDLRQAAVEALDGARRVGQIVQGLRRFARPAGEDRRAPVDVAGEIDSAVAMSRHEVAPRARLLLDVPRDLPPVVAGAHELGQVMVNLLVNAAQAIAEGRPSENEVRVVARSARGRVVVEVADTGQGIPPEALPRVFDPFFTTRAAGGTGLGLAICRGIVTAAGGTLTVESAPGRGTTFRVDLPAAASATPTAAPRPAPEPRPSADAPRRRVLVVDDEPMMGRAVARMLRGAHDVEVLTSAMAAAGRLEAGERWDLVLCDLMMPEMTGVQLAERLARTAPDALERFVFMTGGAYTETAREFLAAGRRHVEKPLDAAAVRELVARPPAPA